MSGRYDGPDGPVSWEIAHDEIQRDLGSAMRRLGELGVGSGDRVLFCSMLSEAGQFWPWILGAMLGGRPALLRRRHGGRGPAGRDVLPVAPLRRRARRHRRPPRRPRRARSALRRRVRRRPDRRRPARGRAPAWPPPVWPRPRWPCWAPPSPWQPVRTGPARVDETEWERHRRRRRTPPRHRPPGAGHPVRDRTHGDMGQDLRTGRAPSGGETVSKRSLISADNHVFEPVTLWQERLPAQLPRPGAARRAGRRLVVPGDRGHARPQAGQGRRAMTPGAPRRRWGAAGRPTSTPAWPTWRRRRGRRGHLPDVRLVHRHDARPRPADGVRAGLQRLAGRDVPRHRPDVFIPSAVVPVRDVASASGRARAGRRPRLQAGDDPDVAAGGTALQPARLRPAVAIAAEAGIPLSLHTGTGALPQHERGPGGAVINYAKVGLLSAETLLLLRRVGCARAFPRPAPRVRRDRRGLAGVLLRAHGRGVRGARAVGEAEAGRARPATTCSRQCLRDARRRPGTAADPRDHRGRRRCCGRPTTRIPRARSPSPSGSWSEIFAGIPEAERDAIVGGNAARLYGVELPDARVSAPHAEGTRPRSSASARRRTTSGAVAAADADGAGGQGRARRARRRRAHRRRPRRVRAVQHGLRHVAVRAVARRARREVHGDAHRRRRRRRRVGRPGRRGGGLGHGRRASCRS